MMMILGLTSVAAQQRLVGKVVDKVLQRSKLVEAEGVAVVSARHLEVFDGVLGSAATHTHQMIKTIQDFRRCERVSKVCVCHVP